MRHRSVKAKTEKLLLDALKYFKEEPLRLDMSSFGNYFDPDQSEFAGVNGQSQEVAPCGTSACIAGSILLGTTEGLSFLARNGITRNNSDENGTIEFPFESGEQARKILGITVKQAKNLFWFKGWIYADKGWPEQYEVMYKRARTANGRLKATKMRIMHFIETGE